MATGSSTRARQSGIPFGERDGRVYAPSDVPRGRSCNCLCPACGAPLRANHGTKRRHYFSHDATQEDGCFESAVHRYAKQVLMVAQSLVLPAWTGGQGMPNPPFAGDGEGRLVVGDRVEWPARTVRVGNGRQEVGMGGVRVDVTLDDADGLLLVEVRVSHAVDMAKADRVRALGLRMVEIDLSSARAVEPDGFAEWVLHYAPRQWVWHPESAFLWQESKARVATIIAARTPVYGPGPNMLVRMPGPQADRIRALGVIAGNDKGSGGDPMVGACVWLQGEGAAELTDVIDRSQGLYGIAGDVGKRRIVYLGPPPD